MLWGDSLWDVSLFYTDTWKQKRHKWEMWQPSAKSCSKKQGNGHRNFKALMSNVGLIKKFSWLYLQIHISNAKCFTSPAPMLVGAIPLLFCVLHSILVVFSLPLTPLSTQELTQFTLSHFFHTFLADLICSTLFFSHSTSATMVLKIPEHSRSASASEIFYCSLSALGGAFPTHVNGSLRFQILPNVTFSLMSALLRFPSRPHTL